MVNIFALLLTLSILAACSSGSMTNVKNAAADPLPPRESKVEYRLDIPIGSICCICSLNIIDKCIWLDCFCFNQ